MNPHLYDAIRLHENHRAFTDLLAWHTAHGVVVVDPDCVLLAYWCRVGDLGFCVPRVEANTLFVSYYGGDLRKLWDLYGDAEHIAFDRRFRGIGHTVIFESRDLKRRIFKQTKQHHGRRISTDS